MACVSEPEGPDLPELSGLSEDTFDMFLSLEDFVFTDLGILIQHIVSTISLSFVMGRLPS